MALSRHNHEAFVPRSSDADIIPLHAQTGEQMNRTELSPAQFHLRKWLATDESASAIASIILNDISADTKDEQQRSLKNALRSSALYDYFDTLCDIDPVIRTLEQRARALAQSGEGMTPERKAILALMEVRATEVIEAPMQDIPLQLERLPLGDEEEWLKRVDQLKG